MGHAARANAARRADVASGRPPIEWATCVICKTDYPRVPVSGEIERLSVCTTCCVADLARLLRSLPGTVRMLPVVRALAGLPQVREVVGPTVTPSLDLLVMKEQNP